MNSASAKPQNEQRKPKTQNEQCKPVQASASPKAIMNRASKKSGLCGSCLPVSSTLSVPKPNENPLLYVLFTDALDECAKAQGVCK